MGFLSFSKEKLRLARLNRQLRSEPRPHGLAELARCYLALGDAGSAEDVLRFGEKLFKDSEELAKVRQQIRGDELERAIADAREAVKTNPSGLTYLTLAEALREAGRGDQCLATLREAAERFAGDSAVLTQLGELRYRRFLESFAVTDGRAAQALFEQSVAAEPIALRARFRLAELFWRVGAFGHAAACIAELMKHEPSHERGALLRDALAARGATAAQAAEEDLFSLYSSVEECTALAAALPYGPAEDDANGPSSLLGDAKTEVERIAAETHAREAMYVDAQGTVFASGCSSQLLETVNGLAPVSQRAARGMELGAPSRLVVEGRDGTLLMEMKKGALIALLLPRKAPMDGAAVSARDALERLGSRS